MLREGAELAPPPGAGCERDKDPPVETAEPAADVNGWRWAS